MTTLLVLGRLQLALGDAAAAKDKLAEARGALALLPTQGVLRDHVEAFEVELEYGAGDREGEVETELTTAELRVLRLLPTHYTLRELGDELVVSRNTIKSQVAAIYRKLDAANRAEAVRRAEEAGLLRGYDRGTPETASHPRSDDSGPDRGRSFRLPPQPR